MTGSPRPAVSVVVPFAGGDDERRRLLEAFAPLQLRADDELIVADNSVEAVLQHAGMPAPWRVLAAENEGSPGHARNMGALRASREWLLFIDSDCRPEPDLIDRFFDEPIAERCGIVAGQIDPDGTQDSLAARYAAARAVVDQGTGLNADFMPYALTANLLIRRALWRELGGFLEGIFNGEDVDFCWRAQRGGWTLEQRSRARVAHANRETVEGLLRQAEINRASAQWVHRRWPNAPLPPTSGARKFARAVAGAVALFAVGKRERARMKALDARIALARVRGDRRDNRARERPRAGADRARRRLEIWCDQFPVVSETFVVNEARALVALGHDVTVVAGRRPSNPALGVSDLRVRYLEDDTRRERARALAALLARRPLACLRDRRARRRWAAEETPAPLRWLAPHVLRALDDPGLHRHAHFAAGAALGAMRVARLANSTWSVAAHGYDVFQLPRNLPEKLRSADLVIGPCAYTVAELRRVGGAALEGRVHEVVMGVDPDRFRRMTAYPRDRVVLGIGRLVEKKGFADLVTAAADPHLDGLLDRVVLVGDGPLRAQLEQAVGDLGLAGRVAIRGRREPEEIREALEEAAVLAMPCVVAADGDRDAMPVVVKEALAMEIPVVATDEVGLPELVREEFGRLVPPHRPDALAAALAELLALSPEERAAMGRAGRAHVMAAANVAIETEKLSRLLDGAGRSA